MAADNSFDIVSKVDLQEVSNAIQNALKEIHTRFDLKDSKSDIQLEGKEALVLSSADEYKVQASIQGDTVRVSGKDRDALQEIIALLRGHDFGIDMQFTNYRN